MFLIKSEKFWLSFSAENSPVLSAFGTISLYFFLLTMATSDFFMKKLGRSIMEKDSPSCAPGMGTNGPSRRPHWDRFCAEAGSVFLYGGSVILILTLLFFRHLESKLKSTASKKSERLEKNKKKAPCPATCRSEIKETRWV